MWMPWNNTNEADTMNQTSLNIDKLEFDDEHPIGENNNCEWIKLENIGDILYGIFTDTTIESTYGKPVFFFNNATLQKSDTLEKKHYERIGINNSGNLQFLLTRERLGEFYKLLRVDDLPPKQKGMNPTHQFRLIPLKKQDDKQK